MNELAKLSPAQTYLILEGSNASLKDLLKLTFMDLNLKQVLKTYKRNFRASKNDPLQVITYIHVGKNYLNYTASNYELAFLTPFNKSPTLKIMFRHIVKMGYENAKSENHFQKAVINSPEIKAFTSQNIFQQLFGTFSLNLKGKELKNKLKEELKYLDSYLPSLLETDHHKALEVLKIIKGNIFLLKNIDFVLLSEIDKELMEQMNQGKKIYESGNGIGCSGCVSMWDSYGHDSSTFDSSFGGGESGGGGSGSTGCSGCSGCSGCGGCGGD